MLSNPNQYMIWLDDNDDISYYKIYKRKNLFVTPNILKLELSMTDSYFTPNKSFEKCVCIMR